MSDSEFSDGFFSRLHAGSESAAEEIDRRYRQRLCALVEREMDQRYAGREDPEDPVQSGFRSFYRGISEGRFRIDSSAKLWRLLSTITLHKMLKHIEAINAAKRQPGKEVRLEGVLLPSPEPRPEDAVAVADLIGKVVEGPQPPDPEIFRLPLQGLTRKEIAERVECTQTTARLKLERMRDRLWAASGEQSRTRGG